MYFFSSPTCLAFPLLTLLETTEATLLVSGTRDKQAVIFRTDVASLEILIEAELKR